MAKRRKGGERGVKAARIEKQRPHDGEEQNAPEGELVDMNEAVRLLGTSRPTFYRWLRAGKIPGVKLGRQWRFYREDLERFLRGQAPRIALAADMTPLLNELTARLRECKDEPPAGSEDDPVSRAVALMIAAGAAMRASDIHMEPQVSLEGQESLARVRCRVDGVLHRLADFDIRLLPPVVARLKGMAGCDAHDESRPQDGRILFALGGRKLDLRVNFLPAVLGESVTLRMLDTGVVPALRLDAIAYAPDDMARLRRALKRPWGLIALAGRMGSGKTTGLYACVNHLAGADRKVMTIEEPVEYMIPWAVQTSVNPLAGLTYQSLFRAVLHSSPDVIMVGEVRDGEVLNMALQAALTGHLVLTTLSVSRAHHALLRMIELGADPVTLADAVSLVVSQRLVRRLCPHCSREAAPGEALLNRARSVACDGGLPWDRVVGSFKAPVGCDRCLELGYRGRNVIAESLEMSPVVARALAERAVAEELERLAVVEGMCTLAADGVRRAGLGETSLEEVFRVAPEFGG